MRESRTIHCAAAASSHPLRSILSATVILLLCNSASAITWPMRTGGAAEHRMLQGLADGSPASVYDFHEGIDIYGGGAGGETVVTARAGTISHKDQTAVGGSVVVKVDIGGGNFEWDMYLHIMIDAAVPAIGGAIAENVTIGTVRTNFFSNPNHHLHYTVLNNPPFSAGSLFEKDVMNPLLRFVAAADRDPLSQIPGLEDTNADTRTLIVAVSNSAIPIAKQTIMGDIELIADVRDPMHASLLSASSPHKVGYWIKALFDQGVPFHGVKTSAEPYVLSVFDDTWFPAQPFANGKFPLVYDISHPVNPNPITWTFDQHFIVTNAKGTDGEVASVENQHWRTNAKDDAAVDTVSYANYSGRLTTAINALARFKDGEYETHIKLGDLINTNVDATAGKQRTHNFVQTAVPGVGGIAPNAGATPVIYAANATPYVPVMTPDPSTGVIMATYVIGTQVGVQGEQYYPNLKMQAHLYAHRAAWNEDDSLAGALATIVVLSDANGVVPLTRIWVANAVGEYDLIIDYDRDGLFSWTLDGLGAFKVIEEDPPPGITDVPGLSIWGIGLAILLVSLVALKAPILHRPTA